MPKQIRGAYKNETRSKDGTPGSKYWQNTADYEIEVKVDPKTRKLEGEETVSYTNNSPDELGFIVIRLYFDVFKKANPRASGVNPEDIGEGVELKSLSINGTDIDLAGRNVQRSATNLSVRLPEALPAGGKMELKTSWAQYIPLTNRRTGAADSTSFFVAYWYPQISVYDDVFGWDTEEYSLRTEFYNNLSSYDVTIQAPKEFLVWATGELQNPDEVYPPTIAERYKRALISEERVSLITAKNLTDGYESLSDRWNYKAQDVTDFAFALSDHYLWDAAIQKVEDRKVLISSVYPNQNPDAFKELTSIQQKIMKHFSEDFPGIPYPFSRFTTFIGLQGGGMEFPMMAYNQGPNLGLTAHEMYHMYFPMYVRINERRFAWMDEGWADYCTSVVTSRYWQGNDKPLFSNFKPSIQGMVGTYEDLPLITSSQFMDASNYGYASYPLPAF
ncbi:MAG: M1 family metallopeptidase, partial [Bacteroidota bacterium]